MYLFDVGLRVQGREGRMKGGSIEGRDGGRQGVRVDRREAARQGRWEGGTSGRREKRGR